MIIYVILRSLYTRGIQVIYRWYTLCCRGDITPFRSSIICALVYMACIDHHGVQVRRFKDIKQRLPIRGCTLHGDHFTAAFFEPVSQCKKFSGCCTKVTYFLLSAASETGNDKLFVHINTTTLPLH